MSFLHKISMEGENMLRIVSSQYSDNGKIKGYVLNNGRVVTNEEAIKMTVEGKIVDAIVGVNEIGARVVYDIPDNNVY